jgi:cell wall-associated NlpC family hydrolase
LALCTAAVAVSGAVVLAPTGQAQPKPTISDVKDRVDNLYHQAEQATERYNAATDKLDDVQRRIERAKAAVAKQEKIYEALQGQLASFVAASYRGGGLDSTLQTLLADDPRDFLAQASVVEAYANQQSDQLAAAAEARRALEQSRLVADEELARQEAIKAELETEKHTVEGLLADAQQILNNLEEDERQRLEKEREQERDEAAAQPDRGDEGQGEELPKPDVPSSEKARAVVEFALSQVGDPYCWGGDGPTCWDCSGLTSAAWAQAGVNLPRSSGSQIGAGTRVSYSQLEPGDLVFYYTPISHVAVYIGNHQIVHAPHPGDVVSVDPLDLMPFSGAARPG